MAAGAGGLTDANDEVRISEPERRVREVLHDRLDDDPTDVISVRASYLDELDYSNSRIGHAIGRLARVDGDLEIEPWTAPTTTPTLWEVKR